MINIHVYPSDFSNESRIFRTVNTIASLRIFNKIEMVGIVGDKKENSKLSDNISIRRFNRSLNVKNKFLTKLLKLTSHFTWSFRVFDFYRRQKISCINAHSLTVLPLCVLLKAVTGAKLVYDTHELESQTNGAGKFRRFFSKYFESKLIPFANVNIFVSNSIKDWYVNEFKVSNTHVILNCPVQTEVLKANIFRERFDIPVEKKIFLYQGVLSPGRGLELIVDTFSKLAETDNVVVIMGYGPLESFVRDAAQKYSNVYFHESVKPDVLLQYTASADVGLSIIFPTSLSYEYCMPNKLFEYINAGIPVIVSPTIEQKNFVSTQGLGLVISDYTSKSLIEAVKTMDNITYYDSAIEIAKNTYTWSTESNKIKKIYTQMFAGNNDEIK